MEILMELFVLVLVSKSKSDSSNITIINSVEIFPSLDFKLPQCQNPYLWDKDMEISYLTGLKDWKITPLRVFVIPFSHNDAGWILTFEDYFDKSSKYIIDHIANLLPMYNKLTFVWSEICFLERWWSRAESNSKKAIVNSIKSGKLEIVTGAWVMPDEATTTVFALLDQLIEGHQWVHTNLGVEVETSWSIDQFGVGSTWPYLLSQSGVKFTLAQRVHWAWKRYLSKRKLIDMVWRKDEENACGEIRLRVQPTTSYAITSSCGPDKEICRQYDFNPDINQAIPIKFLNIRQRVEVLMGQYGRLASTSDDNTAIVTLGTDFRFENGSEWASQYFNYKAIMEYVNSNFDLYHTQISFSTLKEFIAQTRMPETKFVGDFYVYSDLGPDHCIQADYWSGYFSTRPYWKLLGRKLESNLRTAEILFSACNVEFVRKNPIDKSQEMETAYNKITYARRSLGLFQHHDAITGTSTAKVMADFERKLKKSIRYCRSVEGLCVSLLGTGFKETNSMSRLLKDKVVHSFPATVSIFNSLMTSRKSLTSVRVSRTDLSVYNNRTGELISHQINFCDLSDDFELVFFSSLPPLSLSNFYIIVNKTGVQHLSKVYKLTQQDASFSFTIKTKHQSLIFSSESGMLVGFLSPDGKRIPLDVSVKAYESEPTRSGAYLFRPKPDAMMLNTSIGSKNIYVLEGVLYKDVVTNYGDTFSIRTRSFEEGNFAKTVEITTVTDFGPPIENHNLEICLKISSDILGKFYTDVNGFTYRERNFIKDIDTGGNFYPMTEEAYIQNSESRLTLLSDHSHGVANLNPGEITVMLDRRISADDFRGLGEGILDSKRGKSKFLLFLSDISTANDIRHILSLQLNNEAPVFISQNGVTPDTKELVSQSLPSNTHLLNLKTLPTKECNPSNSLLLILMKKSKSSDDTKYAFFNGTIFFNSNPHEISRCLLNGIAEHESFVSFSEIEIQPFSVIALKLFYS